MNLPTAFILACALAGGATAHPLIEKLFRVYPPGSTDLVPRPSVDRSSETSTFISADTDILFNHPPTPSTTSNPFAPSAFLPAEPLNRLDKTPGLNFDETFLRFETVNPLSTAFTTTAVFSPDRPRRVILEQVPLTTKPGRFTFVFTLDGRLYRSLTELKAAVATLPKGSEVVWSPGCIRTGGEPLDTPEGEAFFKDCRDQGLVLTIIPSG